MARKPRQGICALCGNKAELTVDHLPPKCIYSKEERKALVGQMNTVDACRKCNGDGSTADESLKLIIGVSTADERSKEGLEFIEHIGKTLTGNRKLGKEFLFGAKHEKSRVRIDMSGAPFRRAIQRILMGLYFQRFNKVISKSCTHEVFGISQELQFMTFLATEKHTSLNGGTFKYAVNQLENHLFWRLVFFDHAAVYAITQMPSEVLKP